MPVVSPHSSPFHDSSISHFKSPHPDSRFWWSSLRLPMDQVYEKHHSFLPKSQVVLGFVTGFFRQIYFEIVEFSIGKVTIMSTPDLPRWLFGAIFFPCSSIAAGTKCERYERYRHQPSTEPRRPCFPPHWSFVLCDFESCSGTGWSLQIPNRWCTLHLPHFVWTSGSCWLTQGLRPQFSFASTKVI